MHENLMRDIRNAEKCGLSYGHYKALQHESKTACKEYDTGNTKHFDRVVCRLIRMIEKQR